MNEEEKKAAVAAPGAARQNKFDRLKQTLNLLKVVGHLTKGEVIEIGDGTYELDSKSCPLCEHNDAFRINVKGDEAYFNCFSCQVGGDVIHFASHFWRVPPSEAHDRLSELALEFPLGDDGEDSSGTMPLPYTQERTRKEELSPEQISRRAALLEEATAYYVSQLEKHGLAKSYQLDKRKHELKTLQRLRVGFADGKLVEYLLSKNFSLEELQAAGLANKAGRDFIPAGCFVYPHMDEEGRVYRLSMKDPDKKYNFQPRKESRLPDCPPFYGAWTLGLGNIVALVEGENDLISLLEAGWADSVLATNGSLSQEQIDWLPSGLAGKELITIFDNDSAGEKYRQKMAALDLQMDQYCPPGEGSDPDSFLKSGGRLGDLISAETLWTAAASPSGKTQIRLRTEEMHDSTNAVLLERRISQSARYVPELKCWAYCGDDGFWLMDQTHQVTYQGQAVAMLWAEAAEKQQDPAMRGQFVAYYKYSCNRSGLTNMVEVASNSPALRLSLAKFDDNDDLIGVENGVFDLRAWVFRPARPTDYVSKRMRTTFVQGATCPLWLKFLAESVAGKTAEERQAMMDYLQCIGGMALTGYSERRPFFHVFGPPGSGKSVYLNALRELFGNYAITMSATALSQPYHSSNDAKMPEIANLVGARLAVVPEAGAEIVFNEDLAKRITGGDLIMARKLYSNPIEFKCKAAIMMNGNGRPGACSTSPEALMSRFKIIPFPNAIPAERQDKALPDKLKKEFPGILNWLLEGAQKFKESGHVLTDPEPVKGESADYLADSDDLARFIEECCTLGAGSRTSTMAFYQVYKEWAVKNGINPKADRRVGEYMRQKGFAKIRVDNVRCYQGLKIRDGLGITDAGLRW